MIAETDGETATVMEATEAFAAQGEPPVQRPRVVVLGGGVAGLTAAYELRRRLGERAAITVVSDTDRFVLGPALLWVPFGRQTRSVGFPLAPALARHGIGFRHARVDQVDPERRVVLTAQEEIAYDYLLIATGPRASGVAIPGVAGQFNATESIWSETTAVEARHALERYLELEQPGPAVIGAAQGARYLSAAYEFVLSLDAELRRRGTRGRATLTFITPEPYLGHLDVGAQPARRALERLFARRDIRYVAGAAIDRVNRHGVYLTNGEALPAAFSLIMPPFSGAVGLWKSLRLVDSYGFVPVDEHYRHLRYPQIYAVGVAAHSTAVSPTAEGVPQTGYLATAMARRAARNIAAAITGGAPARRSLPRLLDLRLLDGGDTGVLLVSAALGRPLRLALPLPGRASHGLKTLLARYLLWKLRSGRTWLP